MKVEKDDEKLEELLGSLHEHFEIADVQVKAAHLVALWHANPFDDADEFMDFTETGCDLLDEIVDVLRIGLLDFGELGDPERNAYIVEAGARYFDAVFKWGNGIKAGLMEMADYYVGKMLMTFAVGWRAKHNKAA